MIIEELGTLDATFTQRIKQAMAKNKKKSKLVLTSLARRRALRHKAMAQTLARIARLEKRMGITNPGLVVNPWD